MAIVTKEDLLTRVNALAGDDASDITLSLIEDISDTFDSFGEDWRAKYEENDLEWRKRYKERFEKPVESVEQTKGKEDEEKISFDDLFKAGE